ncbi:hypothetical protein C9F11_45820 (plasmid) [Streptomyces sp. YIM 121038]|uniref:transposase family protein n=1 Tax=Streptomyces sp. YIM 121038 TaxID=2136401 RepID=UPI00111043D5|nr:transposase family protein [Streptomyces sp. YIM 121038]QCX82720.1 hypothetical protein C9F11_45820 [Streptomyces sp. YIM 121038]
MFRQKITDGDRILAAILYHRRVCGLDALAELFGVCKSTLWNAIRDVLPILDDRRIDIAPADHRHPTAADLLTSVGADIHQVVN